MRPLLNGEWRPGNNQGQKRRTRVCKVCYLRKDTSSARGGDSSTYCSTCTLQPLSKKSMARRVFLCEKKRHTMKGELRSCFDIWHKCWSNGALAPAPQQGGKRSIRARAPARRQDVVGAEDGDESGGSVSDDFTAGGSRSSKRARRARSARATD
ncbi:hypothetical protein P3T76_014376 [Phytophthora citrophthora]|uniref:PiggyBac transposable element-derived protein 4 C-terminal zinc-ribbon domain-containing protein n=1 Tax=Phytophthora citrophthora TaxID=4793 RepID=A0AAD9LB72_9STRA|nr:hypothetical protein P3T76_014376 [Phytophthora citrophthora]